MFNPRTFENARPDGFPVLEIMPQPASQPDTHPAPWPPESEQAGRPPRLFVPLQRTDLTGEVVGPVAALRLSQRFSFTREQCPRTIEARYRFPLPGDAAVTGVRVRFGEVEIVAELAERAAAEQTYQTARDEGRQAALMTCEAPDVFTLQVAGLRPDEQIIIDTQYVQLARPEGAGWTLRVPLTTVPRYVRADERGAPHAGGQPLAVLRDPGHRFALGLTFEGVQAVASQTHALDQSSEDGRLRVRLADGDVLPDRDCVLTWLSMCLLNRPLLQVLRHDELAHAATCVLVLVAPPSERTAGEAIPREVILLIDHSGSMSGPKWEAADWAVQNVLAGLTPADTFNVGLFHSTTRWFAKGPVRGDARALEQARAFLLQHKDSGGTELGVALEQALGQQRDGDGRARHVLIVTDAAVSDAGSVLALAERESVRAARRRVDVLCIDAAPNSGLALELAERGGGIARFLTSDPDANDIATALDDVLTEWTAPVLCNLTLEVDRPDVQAAGRRVSAAGSDHSRIDLGDVPAGRAVWVAARIIGEPARPLTMRLLADGQELATERLGAAEAATAQPTAADARANRPAVAALFGARRVLDLELAQSSGLPVEERLRQLGYDPAEVLAAGSVTDPPPLYAENARTGTTDALQALLVLESLRYGIASSATAFVAVRQEAGQRVEATVAVANALADGWSDGFLMPRVAAGMGAGAMPLMAFSAPPAFSPAPAPPTGFGFPNHERPLPSAEAAPGSGGGLDLGALASAPLDLARGLTRRLRKGGAGGGRNDTGGQHIREMAAQPVDVGSEAPSADPLEAVFAGVPPFAGGEAVLFDSRTSTGRLPDGERLSQLRVRVATGSGGGDAGPVDDGLLLVLYVDDLAAPRARIRLTDLLRQGGTRPLNVRYQTGQTVRLVLLDPRGAWASGAPAIEVMLA